GDVEHPDRRAVNPQSRGQLPPAHPRQHHVGEQEVDVTGVAVGQRRGRLGGARSAVRSWVWSNR
ncbi:MAG: hypothetical protein ACREMX_05820, partial [Gemmatimonadales bacterium]